MLSLSRLQCQHSLNLVAMISVFAFAVFILSYSFGTFASPALEIGYTQSNGTTTPPLDVFQVQAPLRASYEGESCQQVIVQHNFAASYGTPYVGKNFKLCFNNGANDTKDPTLHPRTAISQQPFSTSQSPQLVSIMTDLGICSSATSRYGGPPPQCPSELASFGTFKKT